MAKSTNPGKGTGSARKNRSNAGRTTARKGKRKSAMAWAKSHVKRSSRAGRASERGGEATFIALDVSDQSRCAACAKQVLAENGKLDILVNNAGIGCVGDVLATKEEDLDRLWRVNVKGVMYLTQAFLPGMVEHKCG